jgi:hypothetical protein
MYVDEQNDRFGNMTISVKSQDALKPCGSKWSHCKNMNEASLLCTQFLPAHFRTSAFAITLHTSYHKGMNVSFKNRTTSNFYCVEIERYKQPLTSSTSTNLLHQVVSCNVRGLQDDPSLRIPCEDFVSARIQIEHGGPWGENLLSAGLC